SEPPPLVSLTISVAAGPPSWPGLSTMTLRNFGFASSMTARPTTHLLFFSLRAFQPLRSLPLKRLMVLPSPAWTNRPQPAEAIATIITVATFRMMSLLDEIARYGACIGNCASAIFRISCVIRIEQNFGPHIEQNLADLKTSCGKVSSCIDR